MSDYTPTTADMRSAYRAAFKDVKPWESPQDRYAEFDRRLAARDRKVKAEALRDAAIDTRRRAEDPDLNELADRYSGYYAGVRSALQAEAEDLDDRADQIEAGES